MSEALDHDEAGPTDATSLYRLYGAAGDLLYVGVSLNVGNRLREHAGSQPWWGEVRRVDVEHHESRFQAETAEWKAVRDELPRWNVQLQVGPVVKVDGMTVPELLKELESLRVRRDEGVTAAQRARHLVEAALQAGVSAQELVGRPFSRAEVSNIKRRLGLTRPRTLRGEIR